MNVTHIFGCALCKQPSPQTGCRVRRVKGLRTRICAACAQQNDREREDGQPTRLKAGGSVSRGGRDVPRAEVDS